MKKAALSLFFFFASVYTVWATGEPSTYFNIYVPPNNEILNRDVCLIVTALYDSTTFNIVDDAMDGDSDDSKSGMLMQGQSYILFIRNNGVNDDAPHSGESATKNDGDYFIITSDKLVFASQATLSGWQHDWVASFNKTSKGEKFIVYSNATGGSKNDINVFAYEDSTMVVVKKISTQPTLQQGYTQVDMTKAEIVMQKMIHIGKDIINYYTNGRDLLADGETYIIEANKPVTVQYGALYGNNERDGGGYVPSSNGSSSGSLFYFTVPYQAANEQEIRIVSWDNANDIVLERFNGTSWVNVKSYTGVNALKAVDWVGATYSQTYAQVFRVSCTPGKRVSVLEANWMETGSPGTSDMATMASAENGTSSGRKFLVYMPPPGNQNRVTDPFTGYKLSKNTHAYLYAKDSCIVTVKDAYTGGQKLNRTYTIAPGRYADVNLTLANWKSIYNGTGTTSGPERPYLLIEATNDISVMVANTNDNWMMYFGSSLKQGILQSTTDSRNKAQPGDTVKITSVISIPGGSSVNNPVVEINVSEGASVSKCRFKNTTTNTTIDGTIHEKKGCGTRVKINGLNTLDSSNTYKVETDIVMQPIGSDNKPVVNNDLVMVDMVVGGTVDGDYQQSSSSTGIINEALNTSNYQFSKVLTGAIVTDSIDTWNACWVDLDKDSYPDLFVPSYEKGVKNTVYINNKSGGFSKPATYSSLVSDKNLSVVSAAFADINNNGRVAAILGGNIGQSCELHERDTTGNFQKVNAASLTSDKGYAQTVNLVDYDNDGKLDVFISEYFPANFCRLYHNEGNNVYQKVTTGDIAQIANYTTGSTWCDYDNDGLQDLFIPVAGTVANPLDKKNLLFHNNGNGNFTKVTQGTVVNDIGNSTAASWCDYDNDGFMDLFVSNASNQSNALYHNNGNGSFTQITQGDIVNTPGNWHGCSWVDYDNDGWIDLFVVSNDTTEGAALYRNNGNGTFTLKNNEIVCGAYKKIISPTWADYDKDGFQDLFVSSTSKNNNHLYHNNGNAHKWLNLLLKGTVSNKSAIGATVSAKATIANQPVWQKRQVTATSGFGSQNLINVCFGFGDATLIDTIIIRWPSGVVQYLIDVQPNQFLQVQEQLSGFVAGNVFADVNYNCTKDIVEPGIKNVKLKIEPGTVYVNTDSSGNFSASLPIGSYTLTQVSSAYSQPTCSTTYAFSVTTAGIINAALSIPNTLTHQGVDLFVNGAASGFKKGFTNQLVFNYGNKGSQAFTNGFVSITIPQGIYMLNATPQWTSQSGNTYTWSAAVLEMASEKTIVITDSVGLSYNKGDTIRIPSAIGNCTYDINPGDNEYILTAILLGAVDPNDITVSPEGEGQEGYIPRKQELTYTVNFENIGNARADKVTIECPLPEALNESSLDIIASTHPCHYQLQDNRLAITFERINLPYKDESVEGSKGFVSFVLAQENNLLPETRIHNEANIMFDYEEPINTGSVLNTIYPNVDIQKSNPLFIYPNPMTGNETTVRAKAIYADIVIKNLSVITPQGKVVCRIEGINSRYVVLTKQHIPLTGTYIITAYDEGNNLYTGVLTVP